MFVEYIGMIATSLPKKILSAPEGALSAGVDAQWVRVFPNNTQSVVGTATLSYGTSASYVTFPSYTAQPVRYALPCGMGRGVYIDPSKSRMNYRVRYAVTTASSTNETVSTNLVGGATSWWDRSTLYNANGQIIDDVTGLAIINHQNQLFSCNAAERDSQAALFGYLSESPSSNQTNLLQGHAVEALTYSGASTIPVAQSQFSYSVPLPNSLIGQNCRNMCPIGSISKLDLELTSNSVMPLVFNFGAAATAGTVGITITIDQMSLDLYYVYLDDKSVAMLPKGELFCHGITNRMVSGGTIAASTTGALSVLCGIRGQSVRSLATRFNTMPATAGTTTTINGIYDSKMPVSSQFNYFLQGKTKFPPAPHNATILPLTLLNSAFQASEAFTQKELRFAGSYQNFFRYVEGTALTAANGYDQWVVNAGSGSSATDLAAFSFAEDLRKTSTSTVLDGVSLATASNNFLELNLSQSNSSAINVLFIAAMDIIFVIDPATGVIESRY